MTEEQSHISRREHPNTYTVQDRSNQEEMQRLRVQDRITTDGMGGPLPEQPDTTRFQRVLDVGCGTGGWLIDLAKTYPTINKLIGIDASGKMLDFARAYAQEQQVSDRIEFLAMDALLSLEFPANSFDLVNHRFALSWLRMWDWPKILREYQRVLRAGGMVRVTEINFNVGTTSPATDQLGQLSLEAFAHAGHYFSAEPDGLISHLPRLLRQHGLQQVQTQSHFIEYRAGTPEGLAFAEDVRLAYRTTLPFIRKWTKVPDNYNAIYEQALADIEQPDFVAKWHVLTAWGTKPGPVARKVVQNT